MKTIVAAIGLGLAGLALAPAAAAPAPAVPAAVVQGGTVVSPNSAATVPTTAPAIPRLAPTPGIGIPTDAIALQPQVTELGQEAAWMHDWILMPVMTLICVLVLVLLGYVSFRFRESAHPVPSKTSHNTTIEIIWTLLPVLILLGIALPSIQLLARQYSPPKADLTVKVIGNQWYWTYQYPDNGDIEIVSNMLGEDKRKPEDGPRLLAVDERMVVPAGAVVKIITTSNDVIHSFAMPAFWVKQDAVPGRLNETWFKVDRPGVYFGQCSELCGARHGFMPIVIQVVPKDQFAAWIASKHGTLKGAAPAAPASPAVAPGTSATPATGVSTTPTAIPGTTTAAPATSQAATTNKG